MPVGLSADVANAWLNALVRQANYTAPEAVFVQLHTGDPGDDGTSNVAANSTRMEATSAFDDAASGGAISNTAAISWTNVPATEDYTHITLWDASNSGNFLASGSITANAVTAGDNFTLPIGDIDLSLTVASDPA